MTLTNTTISADTRTGDTTVPNDGWASFAFPTDANYTLLASQYVCRFLSIIAGVITVTRNLVVPLVAGAVYNVRNNTAQSVQVIGASGTGITIATGKAAQVYCDGVNWNRLTADV